MRTIMENSLPHSSRVWIYAADRVFNNDEAEAIENALKEFAVKWSAHKVQLTADAALLHNCFVVLMVDEANVGASGCSIDSSVRFVKELGAQFNVNFFNRMLLHYFDSSSNSLTIAPFNVASTAYSSGLITNNTLVFNNLIETKQQLDKQWLVNLASSPLYKFVAETENKAFIPTL